MRTRPRIAACVVALALTVGVLGGSGASARRAAAVTAWAVQVTVGYSTFPSTPSGGVDIRSILYVETPGSSLTQLGFTVGYGSWLPGSRWHWGYMHAIDGQAYFDSGLNSCSAITAGATYQLRLAARQAGTMVYLAFYVNEVLCQSLLLPNLVLSPSGAVRINQRFDIFGPANVTTLSSLAIQPG